MRRSNTRSSWSDSFLASLGFKRRKRRKKDSRHRRNRLEQLEVRAMLSGEPLIDDPTSTELVLVAAEFVEPQELFATSRPEFVLIQPELSAEELAELPQRLRDHMEPAFKLETLYTSTGPKAIISFNPEYGGSPPTTLQELRLELRLGNSTLESYDILIDVAEESFRERFLDDRVEKAAAGIASGENSDLQTWRTRTKLTRQLEELSDSTKTLTTSELLRSAIYGNELAYVETQNPVTIESISSLAKRQFKNNDVLSDDSQRKLIYADIEQQTQLLDQDRLNAVSVAEHDSVQKRETDLQRLTLLLAKDLRADLDSEDADLAAAARRVRDGLVAVSDSYSTAFAGLGVDLEIERKTTNSGKEFALNFIETGHYVFNDNLEIDLGDQPAMVQVTHSGSTLLAGLLSTIWENGPVVEDGTIDEQNGGNDDGGATSLFVEGTSGERREALIRFNLDKTEVNFQNPTTISSATFQLPDVTTDDGSVNVYVWNSLLSGGTGSVSDWETESDLDWNAVDGANPTDHPENFTFLKTWDSAANASVDVTNRVERALLYGDANGDGVFDADGFAGDIEAFHLAVTNWDKYVAEYGPRANNWTTELEARVDNGLGGTTLDENDIIDFYRRHGVSRGDYNLDGTVQDEENSGPDGKDWAVFQANLGLTNALFQQGDGDFDGAVDADDYFIWEDAVGDPYPTAEVPDLIFWIAPSDASTDWAFVSQNHTTADGPKLDIVLQPDLALNKFSVNGNNLVVEYSVLGGEFDDDAAGEVKIQLFKVVEGGSDTEIYTTIAEILPGTLGSHTKTITAANIPSGILNAEAGDVFYAKVSGTPDSGTEANTDNNQLDFEFTPGATATVNSLDDQGMSNLISGEYTLRELLAANRALGWYDTIAYDAYLPAGETRLTFDAANNGTPDALTIYDSVAIVGPGADNLTIDANGANISVFGISYAGIVAIRGLTMADSGSGNGAINSSYTDLTLAETKVTGNSSNGIRNWYGSLTIEDSIIAKNGLTSPPSMGGGIYNFAGDVTVQRSTISGNKAYSGGGIGSYSYYGEGSLAVIDSTIADNNAFSGSGGGISAANFYGPYAYANGGLLTVTNSTISGNSATASGGGIDAYGVDITFTNATITENQASSGGGVAASIFTYITNYGSLTSNNTIIARNTTNGTTPSDLAGDLNFENSTYNFIGNPSTSLGLMNGQDGNANNILGDGWGNFRDAELAPLDYYGGPTKTHAILPGSPVIDNGDPGTALVDQRGFMRVIDGDATVGEVADIGAVEYQKFSSLVVNTPLDSGVAPGDLSLRGAINLARVFTEHDSVEFDPAVFGVSQTMPLGDQDFDGVADELVIDFDVTINGPGADKFTIDAGGAITEIFRVQGTGTEATINGVTVTRSGAGSAIENFAALTLNSSEISGNYGRGINNYYGALAVQDSSISGNGTINLPAVGGGIFNDRGDVTIQGSTIADNKAQWGGGIYTLNYFYNTTPQIDIFDSTISGNAATAGPGGGISAFYVVPIFPYGPYDPVEINVTNSTISGNTSSSSGGGIYAGAHAVTLTNSTVAFNEAPSGGGVFISQYSGYSSIEANNTIISNNTTNGTTPSDVAGNVNFSNSKHNLIGHASTAGGLTHGGVNNNIVGVDPELEELGDYGGPTQTHALKPTSPAINAGKLLVATSAGLVTDQRGTNYNRLLDAENSQFYGTTVDIGAVEAHIIDNAGDIIIYGTDADDVITIRNDSLLINTLGSAPRMIDISGATSVTVKAGSGNDTITVDPSVGKDIAIYGEAGDDTLIGGRGNDTLSGGTGNDTYVFAGSVDLGTDTIIEATGEGTDTFDFSELDTAVSLDLEYAGTSAAVAAASRLSLHALIDQEIENVIGTYLDDAISGNLHANLLIGLDGLDTLKGRAGDDILIGGAGDDKLYGGLGDDTYYFVGTSDLGADRILEAADEGTDLLDFSTFDTEIALDLSNTSTTTQPVAANRLALGGIDSFGTAVALNAQEIENVIGTILHDTITGNASANRIEGRGGNDILEGGAGDDVYVFAGSEDLGTDTITGTTGDESDTLDFSGLTIGAGIAIDLSNTSTTQQVISFDNKSLSINLSSSGDVVRNVIGTAFDDAITGNSSANLLEGRGGNDLLAGGAGDDTYVFADSGDIGSDTIAEASSEGTDTLDFSGLGAGINIDLSSDTTSVVNSQLSLSSGSLAEIENVTGSEFNDDITGDSGVNSISGGGGNDNIDGGGVEGVGSDTLDGGIGVDNIVDDDTNTDSPPVFDDPGEIIVYLDQPSPSSTDGFASVRLVADDLETAYHNLDFTFDSMEPYTGPDTLDSGVEDDYSIVDGIFQWHPSGAVDPGEYVFKIHVSDNGNNTATQYLTVKHTGRNHRRPLIDSHSTIFPFYVGATVWIKGDEYLSYLPNVEATNITGADASPITVYFTGWDSQTTGLSFRGDLDSFGDLTFDPDDYAGKLQKFKLKIEDDGSVEGEDRNNEYDFPVGVDYIVYEHPDAAENGSSYGGDYYIEAPGIAFDVNKEIAKDATATEIKPTYRFRRYSGSYLSGNSILPTFLSLQAPSSEQGTITLVDDYSTTGETYATRHCRTKPPVAA